MSIVKFFSTPSRKKLQLYNKALIKQLFKIGRHEIDAYRFYVIARRHFAQRSGIFSLTELMDLLHDHYGFKTLHHQPGNNRAKYRQKLKQLLDQSILFENRRDGRYRLYAEKRFKGTGRSTRRKACQADLESRQAFHDAMIGMILDGSIQKSVKCAAEHTGFSERRIYQATRRNHDAGRWIKTNNFILTNTFNTYSQAERHRRLLLCSHGIATPKPIKSRYRGQKQYHIAFYAANSYRHGDAQGTEGKGRLPVWMRDRLKAIKAAERKHFDTAANLLEFTAGYLAGEYILEHSTAF